MEIITLKDIVIPAMTVLGRAPVKTSRHGHHGDLIIGFGNDGSGVFTVDQESAEGCPEIFFVGESPKGSTHWHGECRWALQTFLKLERKGWHAWYLNEWLPVEYPEWLGPEVKKL